jgi:tetratricopeptide (TPR) repeat protein
MGDRSRAEALAGEASHVARRIGDDFEQLSLNNLLGVLLTAVAPERAERHLGEAIRLAESMDSPELTYMCQLNLGTVYLDIGRLDDARARFKAVRDYRLLEGMSEGFANAELNLGVTEFQAGDLVAAESYFVSAIAAFSAIGFRARLAHALQGLAAVEARTGRAESAARRLGSAAAVIAEVGWRADGSDLEPIAASGSHAALGAARFDQLFDEGFADPPA